MYYSFVIDRSVLGGFFYALMMSFTTYLQWSEGVS